MTYQYFSVHTEQHIAHVAINRPAKANSLHLPAWEEMRQIFIALDDNPAVRVIILSGEGKNFCAGIDLKTLMAVLEFDKIQGEARKREKLRKFILNLQACITAIEDCKKPVIAAIHRACVGGAVDIVSPCDMRYCTEDAYFSIKEIDLGLVADLGTLQRLPTILNPGRLAELAYTGRNLSGAEAERITLVNRVFPNKEDMMVKVAALAKLIASKSPVVLRGTKEMLLYKRDHSVSDALDYMATWNAAMLLSDDLKEAFQANVEQRKAEFSDT